MNVEFVIKVCSRLAVHAVPVCGGGTWCVMCSARSGVMTGGGGADIVLGWGL